MTTIIAKRGLAVRVGVLLVLLASLSLMIVNADNDDQATVWAADAKTVASLQKPLPFDVYTIQLPQGFSEATDESFKDARRSEFNGTARPDGSQASINVWVAQLTPDQAAGDPIALGEKLLEQSGRTGALNYVRTKSRTGMIGVNWANRFEDTCQVQAGNLKVDIHAVNFVWIDQGRLVMVSAYDATRYAKQTLPLLEAAVYSIAPQTAMGDGELSSIVPPDTGQ